MKHLRRACSLTLAFALALSLSLTSAFAADYTTLDPSQFASNIGDTPTITQDGDTVTLSLPEAGVSIILEGVVSFEEFPSGWSSGETFGAFHLADDGRVLMRNDSYEYSSLELMPSYWQAEYLEDERGWVYSDASPILDQYCPIGTTLEYPTTVVAANPDDRSLAVLDDTLPYRTISNILDGIYVNGLYVDFIRDNGRVSLTDRTINGISFDEYYNSAVSSQPAPTEPETVAGFADVPASAWYAPYVQTVVDKDLFAGVGEGTFAPESSMTYAQFLTVLYKFSGDQLPASQGAWYQGYVDWAENAGLVPAEMAGFNPDAAITRQDMAALFGNFLNAYEHPGQSSTSQEPAFHDAGSIAGYASDGVTLCYQMGLMSGNDDGTFAPAATATRAQVAVTMTQMARVMGW